MAFETTITSGISLPRSYLVLSFIPALCVLYGELNEHFPNENWDRVAHEYAIRVGKEVSENGIDSLAMFSGAAGIGLSTFCISQNGKRYSKFLKNINNFITESIDSVISQCRTTNFPNMNDYDVIQGLSGLGNYCMLFCDEVDMKKNAEKILKYLVLMCKHKEFQGRRLPGWYIPVENQFLNMDKIAYPNGNFNLGLSHGIAGPLLVLCNGTKMGIEVEGQKEAIKSIADFIKSFSISADDGLYWGGRVSLEEFTSGVITDRSRRDAWCYGTPGTAFSLLQAGEITNDREYKDSAINSMRYIMKNLKDIYSPTFCHGLAGVAHIFNRFYEETEIREFLDYSLVLKSKILDFYDSNAPFGFYNIENTAVGVHRYNYVGLLDGVVGVIVTLLALENGIKTPWNKAFLI